VRRRELLARLQEAALSLAIAGCPAIWLNGSFVTGTEEPGDYDGAWETAGVDTERLAEPFQGLDSPARTRRMYGGALFPVTALADPAWSVMLEFFQFDKAGNRRGIVLLDPRTVES
jgi:hypothetical protein